MLKALLLLVGASAALGAGVAQAGIGTRDVYTDGSSVLGPRDPYGDGGAKFDIYSDGARVVDKRDVFTDGASVVDKRDVFTDAPESAARIALPSNQHPPSKPRGIFFVQRENPWRNQFRIVGTSPAGDWGTRRSRTPIRPR